MHEDNFSLVPYNSRDHETVLRHGSVAVLFNEESRRISLRTVKAAATSEIGICPLCRKPLDRPAKSQDPDSPAEIRDPDDGFLDPHYFQMLDESRHQSHQTSRSPSPRLQLEQSSEAETVSTRSSPTPIAHDHESEVAAKPHKIPLDAFSQNYFKTFFIQERELGRGGRGVVLLVRHVIDEVDLGRFACKRIPVGDDSEWLRKVLVEVQLLQKLSHPNLVAYRHVWLENFQINQFSPAIPCAFILQQYCNAGDLHNYIFGSNVPFTNDDLKEQIRTRTRGQSDAVNQFPLPRFMQFEEIFSFFRDITSGLHYLHRHNYIHRDLKPNNCLLHRSGTQIRVLVSDFGEMQETGATRKSTGHTGTISFCAPEVLKRSPAGQFGNFTHNSDIFSLGLIVHLMCFGRLPYVSADTAVEENEDSDQLRHEISAWTGMDLEHRARQDLPEKLYKFLSLLLAIDPGERPSTEDILQSIKAGSALHEASERSGMKSTVSYVYQEPGESRARRPSALSRTGYGDEKQAHVETRRPNSPRTLSITSHAQVPSNVMLRNRSITEKAPPPEPPLLLAPPSPDRAWKLNSWLAYRVPWSLRLVLFSVKAYSCLKLCAPHGPSIWIALPLLIVAVVDVSSPLESAVSTLALLGLHFAVIFLTFQFASLWTV